MVAMMEGFEGRVLESAQKFGISHSGWISLLAAARDFEHDLPQQLDAVLEIFGEMRSSLP